MVGESDEAMLEVLDEVKKKGVATGKSVGKSAEESLKALDKAIGRAEATGAKEKKKAGGSKGKLEARLEFLARMYEAKNDEQDSEDAEAD